MSELMTMERIAPCEAGSEAAPPRSVCFVCTGNTCRSPMAAAVANALAEEELSVYPKAVADAMQPRLRAFSRGLYANDGEPISENARLALEAAAVAPSAANDYRSHTAKTVDERDVETADLLVAMSTSHAMELLMRFPHAAKKILCMPEPISDPYGGDLARYTCCLDEIKRGVAALLFSKGD